MQIAAALVGERGRIAGIDLAAIDPPLDLANAIALHGDLADEATPGRLQEALGDRADVVLSDAAPKLTGIRATDRAREEALLETIEGLFPKLLRPGGNLVLKVLDGPEADAVIRRIRSQFSKATTERPDASRQGTSERYLIAHGWSGTATAPPPPPPAAGLGRGTE